MHVLVLVDKKIMTYYLGNCLFSGISDNCANRKLFLYVIQAYKTWLWQAVLLCSKDLVDFSRRFQSV